MSQWDLSLRIFHIIEYLILDKLGKGISGVFPSAKEIIGVFLLRANTLDTVLTNLHTCLLISYNLHYIQ